MILYTFVFSTIIIQAGGRQENESIEEKRFLESEKIFYFLISDSVDSFQPYWPLFQIKSDLQQAGKGENAVINNLIHVYEDFDPIFHTGSVKGSQIDAWQRLVNQWENHYNTKVIVYNWIKCINETQ